MQRQAAAELVRYLSDTAGSYVRSVSIYDEDDIELLFIKDDVDELYGAEEIERIASRMRSAPRRSQVERLFDLGDFTCSLWGFSDGIVLHFPQGAGRGTVVTLEADAARQFNRFAAECAQRIYE